MTQSANHRILGTHGPVALWPPGHWPTYIYINKPLSYHVAPECHSASLSHSAKQGCSG
jgi:hypothetical protein